MWNVVYGEFKFLLGDCLYTVFRVNLFDRREEEIVAISAAIIYCLIGITKSNEEF